jgi:hypothetical protein
MARFNGLLLRAPDGTMYFVEGGLRPHKMKPNDHFGMKDIAQAVESLGPHFADDRVNELQRALRDEQGASETSLEGVFLLQAFNVSVERDDLGDMVTAGSSSSFSGM